METDILEQLAEELNSEFEDFRSWLLQQQPEVIVRHSYEYYFKEALAHMAQHLDITPEQAESLLRTASPLDAIYSDSMSQLPDNDLIDHLSWCAASRADDEMDRQRNEPVYTGTQSEAEARGELDLFNASAAADAACKESIANAIGRYSDGWDLEGSYAAEEVCLQFGSERTVRVADALTGDGGSGIDPELLEQFSTGLKDYLSAQARREAQFNRPESLAGKMVAELRSLRDRLRKRPREEILDCIGEYAVKRDIEECARYSSGLSTAQQETLMRMSSPLNELYRDVMSSGLNGYMNDIRTQMARRANAEMEKQRAVPVYTGTRGEAEARFETAMFDASE